MGRGIARGPMTVFGMLVAMAAGGFAAQGQPPAGSAAAIYADAKRLDSLNQMSEARARFEEAIRQAEQEPDSLTLALARYEVGFILWGRTQYDSALTYLRAALPVQLKYTDLAQLGRVHNTTGASYYQLGLYEQALDSYLAAREARQLAGDTLGMVRTISNIGKTYHDWGQYARAHASFDEAIALAKQHARGAPVLGYALVSKAYVAIDEREFDDAARLIAESRTAYNRPSTTRRPTDSLDSWELNEAAAALLLLRRGQARDALPMLDAVVQSAAGRGNLRNQIIALLSLSEAKQTLNDRPGARDGYIRALALSQQAGQRVAVMRALRQLAFLEDALGAPARSVGYFKAFGALRDTLFSQDAASRIATREARAETERVLQQNAAQEALIGRQRTLVLLSGLIVCLALGLVVTLVRSGRRERARTEPLRLVNDELREALGQVKVLSGLIPICAHCKKVRDDQGYWNAVESFIGERSDARFSHSICQSCGPKLYGDVWADVAAEMTPP